MAEARRRRRRGADPTPGQRRRRGADPDHPRQQGAGVPGGPPARSSADLFVRDAGRTRCFHDADGARCLRRRRSGRRSPRPGGPRVAEEAAARTLRLLYVALTRAQSPAGRPGGCRARRTPQPSPLHRMLFGRATRAGRGRPDPAGAPTTPAVLALARQWQAARRPGGRAGPDLARPPIAAAGAGTGALASRRWTRRRPRLAAHVVHRADAPRPPRPGSLALRSRAGGPATRRRARPSPTPPARARRRPRSRPRDGSTCAPRWPTCRSGRRSGRWCTPCSSTPTRPRRTTAATCAPSCGPRPRAAGALARRRSTPSRLADALVAVLRHPARAARRRDPARIARADRLCELDFELPLAGGDDRRPRGSPGRGWRDLAPLLRAHLPADDPLRPYADVLETAAHAGQLLRGYLTGSVDVLAAGRRPRYRRRRLQDQLAGRPGRATLTARRYTPRGAGRGDGPLQLPAAGPAVRRGAAPLPALAAARLRPAPAPRRRDLPLRARDVRAGHPAGRRPALRGVRLAPSGALVEAVSDLLDGLDRAEPAS